MKFIVSFLIAGTTSLLSLISFDSFASDLQVELKTPRGRSIQIDIYNPGLKNVLILGPGAGCRPRLDIYESVAQEGKNNGFSVVRLYWAYCVADPQNGRPSEDLSLEKEDFLETLGYVRNNMNFSDSNIFIGGKSLGSFVSLEIFSSQKSLQALLMLTPVCTDIEIDPGRPKNIFSENYPTLALETRLVLLAQGNVDQYCEASHFQDYLKGKGNNFVPLVVKGDHGLGIQNPDHTYNPELGTKNLQVISKWIFTWLK
jgi:predicted alpha/beta-hydrolase family hydrolase